MDIVGVEVTPLRRFDDSRGSLWEGYRASTDGRLAQFNVQRSRRHVLRGVHLHFHHADRIVMASGRCVVALFDCRDASPTFGVADAVEVVAGREVLEIPIGVAHGFWFPEEAVMVYSLDNEWDPSDDIGCRWDDEALAGMPWDAFGDATPFDEPGGPILSERDRAAPSFASMLSSYRRVVAGSSPASH